MQKLLGLYHTWQPVGRRVWRESRLPLIGAFIWSVAAWYLGRDFFAVVSAFSIAFLFVLFAQGQVLRIAKNVRDEDDANEFRNSFATIQQGLDELKRQRADVPAANPTYPTSLEPSQPNDAVLGADELMAKARRAIDSGVYYGGTVLAAIGFEKAIRETTRSLDNKELPIAAVLNQLTMRGDESRWRELRTLVKLRNGLVHAQLNETRMDKNEANQLLQAFQEGIDIVRTLGRRRFDD